MEITLPTTYKIIKSDDSSAVFEIENLYPGYGMTIGNALRRVLLSSLKGAAVTMVKIRGTSHEFSSLPHIIEDAVEIILNLKQVRFRLEGDEPQKALLKVKGTKEVSARDIEIPSQLTVINKTAHIASLTDKRAELEIEMVIERGIGYVPIEQRRREKLEIGAISIDAIFTPVRKVNYEIENMRVGDRTDFNRLKLSVETDGSITPEESLKAAIDILIKQFNALIGSVAEEPSLSKKTKIKETQEKESSSEEDILKTKIDDLNLSTRVMNALNNGGIKTLGGLIKKSESDLKKTEGMGGAGIKEINQMLAKLGYSLKEE